METSLRAAGFDVVDVAVEDLEGWLDEAADRAVVYGVGSDEDLDWFVESRATSPRLGLVLLCPEVTAAVVARAFRAGALAVLAWGMDPDDVARAVQDASQGRTFLPLQVVRELADHFPLPFPEVHVSPPELTWLRWLARGYRIVDLADNAGYSTRHMSRLLRALYVRMGAANRTEAIILAHKWGLV